VKIFKIGDVIYVPSASWTDELIECPVCAGTTWVLVKPVGRPDSEGSQVRCDYCTKYDGWGHSPGKVRDNWKYRAFVTTYRVDGVLRSETAAGEKVEYKCNATSGSWSTISQENAFETQEEALVLAELYAAKASLEHGSKKYYTTEHTRKSASWKVGYHQRELVDILRRYKWNATKLRTLVKERK